MSLSSFLHTVKWFQVLLYKSQFNISHLFTQFVLFDPLIGPYQELPFWVREDLEAMAMKGTPNLQSWSLGIRLFNVISRTLVGGDGGLAPGVFYSPS